MTHESKLSGTETELYTRPHNLSGSPASSCDFIIWKKMSKVNVNVMDCKSWNLDHKLESLQLRKFIGLLQIYESINYVSAIMCTRQSVSFRITIDAGAERINADY